MNELLALVYSEYGDHIDTIPARPIADVVKVAGDAGIIRADAGAETVGIRLTIETDDDCPPAVGGPAHLCQELGIGLIQGIDTGEIAGMYPEKDEWRRVEGEI